MLASQFGEQSFYPQFFAQILSGLAFCPKTSASEKTQIQPCSPSS